MRVGGVDRLAENAHAVQAGLTVQERHRVALERPVLGQQLADALAQRPGEVGDPLGLGQEGVVGAVEGVAAEPAQAPVALQRSGPDVTLVDRVRIPVSVPGERRARVEALAGVHQRLGIRRGGVQAVVALRREVQAAVRIVVPAAEDALQAHPGVVAEILPDPAGVGAVDVDDPVHVPQTPLEPGARLGSCWGSNSLVSTGWTSSNEPYCRPQAALRRRCRDTAA